MYIHILSVNIAWWNAVALSTVVMLLTQSNLMLYSCSSECRFKWQRLWCCHCHCHCCRHYYRAGIQCTCCNVNLEPCTCKIACMCCACVPCVVYNIVWCVHENVSLFCKLVNCLASDTRDITVPLVIFRQYIFQKLKKLYEVATDQDHVNRYVGWWQSLSHCDFKYCMSKPAKKQLLAWYWSCIVNLEYIICMAID